MSKSMPTCPARTKEHLSRNLKIIEMVNSGRYTQTEIARMFNITQGRVSQIIHNPSYRQGMYYEISSSNLPDESHHE